MQEIIVTVSSTHLKGQLLSEIEKYYPFADGKITKYAEPFVGGGAVLFDILSKYDLDEVYILSLIHI